MSLIHLKPTPAILTNLSYNIKITIYLQQADMIFTGLTMAKERSEAVDFTFPFWEEPTTVVFRIWDRQELYFYKPLRWEVNSNICTYCKLMFVS